MKFGDGHYSASDVYRLIGLNRFHDAELLALAIIRAGNVEESTWLALGMTYVCSQKYHDSIKPFKKALLIEPNNPITHCNLGNSFRALGEVTKAEAAYRQAVEIAPEFVDAQLNLASLFLANGNLVRAKEIYAPLVHLNPDLTKAHTNLAYIYQRLGCLEKAEEHYLEGIRTAAEDADIYYNYSTLLVSLGRFEEAISSCLVSIKKNGGAKAYRALTRIPGFVPDRKFCKQIENTLGSSQITKADDECQLRFALANAYELMNDHDRAFSEFKIGNEIRKKELQYNIDTDLSHLKSLLATYPRLAKLNLEESPIGCSRIPIFIVGMPRSGTTLVEQVISSHPSVTGCGELTFVGRYGDDLARGKTAITVDHLKNFREQYLTATLKSSGSSELFADKMPLNFRYIGLISKAFPTAKIIHVSRDPVATCWSNFKQYFHRRAIGFAYDLRDLKIYYQAYKEMMSYWESILGDRIYKQSYEMLTEDKDSEISKLFDFLGLDPTQECYFPHLNERQIKTASDTQIRQPIYSGASLQYKKYEKHLTGIWRDLFDERNG